ncbi:hypothetical protein J3R83DRAFT_5525 [Lanmaoa asiatica]|nr:hypothetical protein J3R83DRAFT_5525 [Lanmaoa asiatica]
MPRAPRTKHRSKLLTPPATSPVASEMSLDPPSPARSASSSGRFYTCPFDLFMMERNPDHHQLVSEEHLIRRVLQGRSSHHLEEAWKHYVIQMKELVDRLKATKPLADKPSEATTTGYYNIPDSQNLAIRAWDGNFQEFGLYCFDLYNRLTHTAVNLPHDYKICHASNRTFVLGGRGSELVSWERAWNVPQQNMRPGQERFVVPEGSQLALVRPAKEPFYFVLPRRQTLGGIGAIAFAQLEDARWFSRMKRDDIRQACREKLALNIII